MQRTCLSSCSDATRAQSISMAHGVLSDLNQTLDHALPATFSCNMTGTVCPFMVMLYSCVVPCVKEQENVSEMLLSQFSISDTEQSFK